MRYHGKGPLSRAGVSAAQRAAKHNDQAIEIQWTESATEDQSYIDETVRILGDDPNMIYNEINQKGLRLLLKNGIL